MDIQDIKALIEIVSATNISNFEMEKNGFSIKMEKGSPVQAIQQGQDMGMVVAPMSNPVQERLVPAQPLAESPVSPAPALSTGTEVKAPLVGVFYGSPAPDQPAFVTVGTPVKKGDVLCIIEAMKVMNEITAEQDGTVQAVLVNNEDLVEYGQSLFVIG